MRALILLLAAIGGYFLLRRLYRKYPLRFHQWLLLALSVLLIGLVILGKGHWLLAVAGAVLPFLGKAALLALRFFPLLQTARRVFSGNPQEIRMRARWLQVTIHRASGAVDGVVLRGPLRGRALSALNPEEYRRLKTDCLDDPRSLALLLAYERRAAPAGASGEESPGADAFEESRMSARTAAQVLGVSADATANEIRAAHRTLVQKLHPDRGGSDYLTRKINEARDVLLKNSKN